MLRWLGIRDYSVNGTPHDSAVAAITAAAAAICLLLLRSAILDRYASMSM